MSKRVLLHADHTHTVRFDPQVVLLLLGAEQLIRRAENGDPQRGRLQLTFGRARLRSLMEHRLHTSVR